MLVVVLGDEYDSGDEVVADKDDDDFIDGDDDLEDVLGEYNQETQRFADERPLPDDEHPSAGRGMSNDDFFDQTLKSLKTGRSRAKLNLSAQEMEQITQEVLYRMDKAYTDDMQAIEQRRPALEKIKFVDSALHVMRKVQLQPMLLDFDVLSVSCDWIRYISCNAFALTVTPRMDVNSLSRSGSSLSMTALCLTLASAPRCSRWSTACQVHISLSCCVLSDMIANGNIFVNAVFKEHLKRSGFGKVVMVLMKHPQEVRLHYNQTI